MRLFGRTIEIRSEQAFDDKNLDISLRAALGGSAVTVASILNLSLIHI